MTLYMTKTTSGYIVEGSDSVGKPVELFYSSEEAANYDRLTRTEQEFNKHEEFKARRAALPDPERDLYISIFGAGNEPEDKALHTTLVEPKEAQLGMSLDWTVDDVTVVLRLIHQRQVHRLRLVAGRLVDTGPKDPAQNQTPGPVNVEENPFFPKDTWD